jgi:hypothetical protein
MKDVSKNNKKRATQFAGCVRHKNPLFCTFTAMAEYIIEAFGKHGRRTFPNLNDPRVDWTKSTLLFSDAEGRPVHYSKKKNTTDIAQYECFIEMKHAAGLLHVNKATHYRQLGSMYAIDRGAIKSEVEQLGRWSVHTDGDKKESNVCLQYYLRNINMNAAFALADCFQRSKPETCYKLPRGRSIDVGNVERLRDDADYFKVSAPVSIVSFPRLGTNPNIFYKVINEIFPGIFSSYAVAYKRRHLSETSEGVLHTIILLLASWIQDASVLIPKYPQLRLLEPYSILYEDPEVTKSFEKIQKNVLTHVNLAEDILATETQLEREDVVQAINNMGTSIKAHTELTVRQIFEDSIQKQKIEFVEQGHRFLQNIATGRSDEVSTDTTASTTTPTVATTTTNTTTTGTITTTAEVDTSTKYQLKNGQGSLTIQSYVVEWEKEVLPRINAGNLKWWRDDDARQYRFQRKILYDVLSSIPDSPSTDNTAKKFEDHLALFPNVTWSDVVTLMVRKRKDISVNIFDNTTLQDIIAERKRLQTKEGKRKRSEEKAERKRNK